VLLVEEHAIARRALRNQLLDWSLEVYTAAERARLPPMLHHAAQAGDPFDLVMVSAPAALLDLHPLYAQLAAARDIYAGPILLLVNAEHCDLPQSLQADTAIRCLAKPPRLKTLHATLAQLLGVTAAAAPEAPTTASAASSAFAGLRVLLAEDNDFNRTLITTWLQAKGVVVDVAHDGEAAVQRARAQRHDVILMDIHMPVLDGIEAARRIRAAEEYATHVPIIALTADVFAGERNNLLAAGMDDCVFKPVREELLWDAIARLTGRAPRAAAADASAAPLPTEASAVPAALYQKLYAELPLHQQQIHAAFTAGDCVAAREAAHRLSGVAGYFGVATLARLARELERALQASGLDVARPVHEALDREIARVLADREAADD
jgi:CheY-like chemotaxis protein